MNNQNDGPLKVREVVREDGKKDTFYGNSQLPDGYIDDPNHGHMVQNKDGTIIALRPEGPKGTPDIVNTGEWEMIFDLIMADILSAIFF